MARPLRLSFPGACYHIMARGNAKSLIFIDAEDYRRFLEILAEVAARFSIVVYAYCLMPNHYHLVCRTREANLSLAVGYLNAVYAQWWNRRHERCGHVTQGRFKAQLVQSELYLRVVCRYVLDNPVRAGLARHPQDWEWSSSRASSGLCAPPAFLDTSIGCHGVSGGQAGRITFEGLGVRADRQVQSLVETAIKGDVRFLGDDSIRESFRHLVRTARDAGIARREWVGIRPTLAELFAFSGSRRIRDRQMVEARDAWGFTQREIAEFLGVHVDTVGRTIRRISSCSEVPSSEV